LLAFSEFNKEFHMYTDASNKQQGPVIMQEGKPLKPCSNILHTSLIRTIRYSTLETLKKYRHILLGQELIEHTCHNHILYGKKLSNDCTPISRLFLEEYGPHYIHTKGKHNTVADASLSCIHKRPSFFESRVTLPNNSSGNQPCCMENDFFTYLCMFISCLFFSFVFVLMLTYT
jgi:hypothetical protein